MKKYQFTMINILICLLLFSFVSIASAEKNNTSIQWVNNGINFIQKYQVNLNTKIFPPNASDLDPNAPDDFDSSRFMELRSKVLGESGKKMKMIIAMNSTEMGVERESTLLFDGTWLWVQQKIIKQPQMKTNIPMISAMKIHIPSVSPDPVKEPFNTIYGVAGNGIYRYKDLPGTFMQLIEDYSLAYNKDKTDSKNIVFSGTQKPMKQNSKIAEVDKDLSEFMNKSTNYCELWVSKKDGLIKAYSIGYSEKRPTMKTEIEYITVNLKLPDDTFLYVPPEDVIVRDITANILKQKANNK